MSNVTRYHAETAQTTAQPLRFAWAEITGKCPLECLHCYAESGPTGTHGTMRTSDWMRVIGQIARLGAEVIQFIGGEPTKRPGFVLLANHALGQGMNVEVFSNLVAIKPEHWELFKTPGVSVATSYYSDDPEEHSRITKHPKSHELTTRNIERAIELGIPLRIGLIAVEAAQRTEQARSALEAMGVTEIGYDDLRQVGRGERQKKESIAELCGGCTDGVIAISPTGEVWPCVFSRWLPVGNVHENSLAEILAGTAMAQTQALLNKEFASRCSTTIESTTDPGRIIPPQMPCGPYCPPNCIPNSECMPKCRPLTCPPVKQPKPRP